jgi:hypothetical protein
VPFNGGMKEEATRHLFPYIRGGWRQPWWQREAIRQRWRLLYFGVGRKKEASEAGWAKKVEWAGWLLGRLG